MKCILWKKFLLLVGICVLSFVFGIPANACTAFSVKTDDNVYFAKNWDFLEGSEEGVTIYLEQMENGISCLVFTSHMFITSTINSNGFFATCNDVYNITPNDCEWRPDTIDITMLQWESAGFKNVNELKDHISDKTVLCYTYPEHVFYADKTGAACVLETDNTKHYIIEPDKDFLVATNFPLYTLNRLDDVSQCFRYKVAYEGIEHSLDRGLDFSDAVRLLRSTTQPTTIYSFVYNANENAVYLYLGRDFQAVWKFSFDTNTLSTYQGFEKDMEFELDEEGIRLMDLIAYQEANKATPEPTPELTPSPTEVPPTPSATAERTPAPTLTVGVTPAATPEDSSPNPESPVANPNTGNNASQVCLVMLMVIAIGILTRFRRIGIES